MPSRHLSCSSATSVETALKIAVLAVAVDPRMVSHLLLFWEVPNFSDLSVVAWLAIVLRLSTVTNLFQAISRSLWLIRQSLLLQVSWNLIRPLFRTDWLRD